MGLSDFPALFPISIEMEFSVQQNINGILLGHIFVLYLRSRDEFLYVEQVCSVRLGTSGGLYGVMYF